MSEADVMKDMLKGFGKLAEETGMGDEEVEKAGGILEQLIDGYGDLNEDEKADFRKSAVEKMMGRMQEAMRAQMQAAYLNRIGLILFCVLVILFIFVFFGYKLIKSIQEKERKKEEKKKQKQSKKKK